MRLAAALLVAFAALAARAQEMDRDMLLTESAAVPQQGTVRVTGGATATTQTTDGTSAGNNTSSIAGSVQWTPVKNLSADVGASLQIGASGPSARLRYQLLSQDAFGIDLTAGVRFKTVGFHPDQGEVEMSVAGGRRIGHFELVLNGVFGVETGGEQGKDLEVRSFAGWRFNDSVRAGVDARLQTEVEDEAAAGPKVGRDYDFAAGPAVSWMVTRTVQLQALVGVAQPKKLDTTSPLGLLAASFDF